MSNEKTPEKKIKAQISKKAKVSVFIVVAVSLVLVFSPYARGWINEVILDPIGITCLYKRGFGNCETKPHPEGALTRRLLEQEKEKEGK